MSLLASLALQAQLLTLIAREVRCPCCHDRMGRAVGSVLYVGGGMVRHPTAGYCARCLSAVQWSASGSLDARDAPIWKTVVAAPPSPVRCLHCRSLLGQAYGHEVLIVGALLITRLVQVTCPACSSTRRWAPRSREAEGASADHGSGTDDSRPPWKTQAMDRPLDAGGAPGEAAATDVLPRTLDGTDSGHTMVDTGERPVIQ